MSYDQIEGPTLTNEPLYVDKGTLKTALAKLFNEYGVDSALATPDYIIARYVVGLLGGIRELNMSRDKWFGKKDNPGEGEIS